MAVSKTSWGYHLHARANILTKTTSGPTTDDFKPASLIDQL